MADEGTRRLESIGAELKEELGKIGGDNQQSLTEWGKHLHNILLWQAWQVTGDKLFLVDRVEAN